jgi:dienelactone hydrolase
MAGDPVHGEEREVQIGVGPVTLDGTLAVPPQAGGIVLFAHGSGSSRHSPRNRHVAGELRRAGLATLLFDLLTAREEALDMHTAQLRFDIGLLAGRLAGATDWVRQQPATASLPVGYFGASTGAAAALVAAGRRPDTAAAIVSRGGRPDLAGEFLPRVTAPTLLIVGGEDGVVIELNQQALDELGAREKKLEIIPGATHLFSEPGALEKVAELAADWFLRHLGSPACP